MKLWAKQLLRTVGLALINAAAGAIVNGLADHLLPRPADPPPAPERRRKARRARGRPRKR